MERRKIPRNPYRRNDGKLSNIRRGVRESEKRHGLVRLPPRVKQWFLLLLLLRICYPLDFYYQFSCSFRILQSNKVTKSTISVWKVVSRRHSVTLCSQSEVILKATDRRNITTNPKRQKVVFAVLFKKQLLSLKYISIQWESNKITVDITSATCVTWDWLAYTTSTVWGAKCKNFI